MRLFVSTLAGVLLLVLGVGAASSGDRGSAQVGWALTDLGVVGSLPGGHPPGGLGPPLGWTGDLAINDRGQVVGTAEAGRDDEGNALHEAFLWQRGKRRDLGLDLGIASADGHATAINGRGQIVGRRATEAGDERAFLWQDGKLRDLDALSGRVSEAVAINDSGQVVGWMRTKAGRERAFLWEEGRLRDLGTVGRSSRAVAINERGQVVGEGMSDVKGGWLGFQVHPFLWESGTITDLMAGLGADGSAVAINDRGQIVGSRGGPAVMWEKGEIRELGTLGWPGSRAVAINERGQVVGTAAAAEKRADGTRVRRAFLWENGRMRDLGALGGRASEATAINERGQVVGWAATMVRRADGSRGTSWHAFVWENGAMTDLGTLGGRSKAVAVNNPGQILGWSATKGGEVHAVLWTKRG